MADDNFSRSEGVARHIALKSERNKEQLVRRQIRFLQEHIELRGKHEWKLRLEIVREGLHIFINFALVLLVIALFSIAAQMVFAACKAKNVVIEAFDVPSSMEWQGDGGRAVALRLRDRLQALQDETRASGAKRGVIDDWSGDIKLEIPEAHISLGEIRRYLRSLLGNETRIGGALSYDTYGAIELTVRGDGFLARTFSGEPHSLGYLINQAAEYIYSVEETYRFASYLTNQGRNDEAIDLVKKRFTAVVPSDQILLLNVWGNALDDKGRLDEALTKYQNTLVFDPGFWIGYNNIMEELIALQREGEAFKKGLEMESRSRRGRLFPRSVPEHLFYVIDWLRRDLRSLHRGLAKNLAENNGHGTANMEVAPRDALILILMHDYIAANREMDTVPNPDDGYTKIQIKFNRGVLALLDHKYKEALNLLEDADTEISESTQTATPFEVEPHCLLARAAAWANEVEMAMNNIDRNGKLVDCYCAEAERMDLRGDWEEAQKQYKAAVDLADSLPTGYFSWGEALLRHGDLDVAISKFKDANQRGPHWADPLKSWGDALAAKGDSRGAVAQYSRAEEFAPNWGQLHLHWGRELDKLGQREKAKEQCAAAALSGDLTHDELDSLKGWCQ